MPLLRRPDHEETRPAVLPLSEAWHPIRKSVERIEPRMQIHFKRIHRRAQLPVRSNAGDAGLDFFVPHDISLGVNVKRKVFTGLAVDIPMGWAGLVFPRSSLGTEHDTVLANTVGIIDAGYRGEIAVVLKNNGNEPFTIKKGQRFAQMLIMPVMLATPVEVDELSASERGTGGFGSTGK